MDKNFLEFAKVKKQVMKLSAVAFIGAISVFGFAHGVIAMKQSSGATKLNQDTNKSGVKPKYIPVDKVEKVSDDSDDIRKSTVSSQQPSSVVAAEKSGSIGKVEPKREVVVAPEDEVKRQPQGSAVIFPCGEHFTGIAHSGEQAVTMLHLAAASGDAVAQSNLGVCYLQGIGVPKDEKIAIEWFERSVQQGCFVAQNELGKCYMHGIGVSIDPYKAFNLFELAARQGYDDAQNNLGYCYQNGVGVSKNHKNAFKWFGVAAKKGHVGAQNNLGYCYQNGIGVRKDRKRGFELYKLAADKGYVEAQVNLAWCYKEGSGVAKDCKKAFELYKNAAEQGNITAQNRLEWFYQNGIAVKDEDKALTLCQQSVDQGDDDFYECIQNLKSLKEDMISVLDVKIEQEKLDQIVDKIRNLSDLQIKIQSNIMELSYEYAYCRQALKFLNEKMDSTDQDKKYVEKVYSDLIIRINEFKLKKEKIWNTFKTIKLYFCDIKNLLPDLSDVSKFQGYFNLFGYIRLFIDDVNFKIKFFDYPDFEDIRIVDCYEHKMSAEDNANISIVKEKWNKIIEGRRDALVVTLMDEFWKSDNCLTKAFQKNVRSLKDLSLEAQEIYAWMYTYLNPAFNSVCIHKEEYDSETWRKILTSRQGWQRFVSINDETTYESIGHGQNFFRNIDIVYKFSKNMELSKNFDLYYSFLEYWDQRETALIENPKLKLKMMIANLKLYNEYIAYLQGEIEKLPDENAKLKTQCSQVKKYIGGSLSLLDRFKSMSEVDFKNGIGSSAFSTKGARDQIKKLFDDYQDKLAEKMNLVQPIDQEVVAQGDTVSAEPPQKTVVIPEKSASVSAEDISREQDASQSKNSDPQIQKCREDEAHIRRAMTLDDMQAMFDALQNKVTEGQKDYEGLVAKHQYFVAKGYTSFDKGDKLRDFTKKDEIVRKLSEFKEYLDCASGLVKVDNVGTMESCVLLLTDIVSQIQKKKFDLERLLLTAENFMKEKVKPVKVKSLSFPKVEEKVEKTTTESVVDIESINIVFYDDTAKKQYMSFIDLQTDRDFKDGLSRYIIGESVKNFRPLPNKSFDEYKTARKGRIFFRLDEDFHNNHKVIILGATSTHDNSMIDDIDSKLKKGKK